MIDYSIEIFNAIGNHVKAKHPDVKVIAESVRVPAQFPCVSIDEIFNAPSHMDSSESEMYSAVTYRVQVFCTGDGKRSMAREIFATVAEACYGLNLIRKTYTTTPDYYDNNIYQIAATFEAEIGRDGVIYRR